MKLGFCTLAFRQDDIHSVVRNAAKIGFDEVDLFWQQLEGKSDTELDAVAATARDCGIGISGISPYFWLTQNEELRQQSMDTAEACSQAARRIGARMIRTFTDAGPTGIGSDVASDEHWDIAVDCLKTITANAPELTFAVETHKKTLADCPDSCEQLRQRVAADNLKFIFQPFAPGSTLADFERLRPHVRQVHLNPHIGPHPDADLDSCGVDYAELIQHLARTGYEHAYALEFCKVGEATWERVENAFRWCREQENIGRSG